MSVLDDKPFPIGDRDAEKLVRLMASLFYDENKSVLFAARFGFDQLLLRPGLAPIDRWYSIFGQLAEARRVRDCVVAARENFNENAALEFLDRLIAFVPARMEVTPGFQPWQYLGLFDRSAESSLLAQYLFAYSAPLPLQPMAVSILAERADEYTYFLERVRDEILRGLYDGIHWQEEWINWAPTAAVSAEFELRKIAAKKPCGNRGELAKLLPQLRKALAGRSMWLMLRSSQLRQPDMLQKLDQFLALWGQLGTDNGAPPVLCLAIVRWDDGDPGLQDVLPIAAASFTQARNNGVLTFDPVTLGTCDVSDFDEWGWTLSGLGRKLDQLKYDALKKSFDAPFRLSRLKDRLAEGPIYS